MTTNQNNTNSIQAATAARKNRRQTKVTRVLNLGGELLFALLFAAVAGIGAFRMQQGA